jgi:hypothetical protein
METVKPSHTYKTGHQNYLFGTDLSGLLEFKQDQGNRRNILRFRTVSSMNDSPPPYSARSPSPSLSPNPVAQNPLVQLRRYLIEIIGFTFDADFSLLNQALGQTASVTPTSPTNSILTPNERVELLDLVTLIKELNTKISDADTQWLTVRSSDREAVADAVIRPALYLGLPASYILELVSTYALHQCDESKRSLSFILQRKPYFYSMFRSLSFLGPFNVVLGIFTNELWSLAHIVKIVAPNEEVRMVLGNAMHTYQKEVLGIEEVMHIESFWERHKWRSLKKALISENEEDGIKSARWHREWKKVDKKVESDGLRYTTCT